MFSTGGEDVKGGKEEEKDIDHYTGNYFTGDDVKEMLYGYGQKLGKESSPGVDLLLTC